MPFEKGKFSFEDRFQATDQINTAMKQLTQNEYMYFRLYFIEGMTHKEISKDIDVPEGTSKSQLSRACKHMREYIIEFDKIRV